MTERPRLVGEVAREIDQVAHFGSAKRIKDLVVDAGEAIEAGEHQAAIDALVEAKRKAPRSAYVRSLLGVAYYHLEMWREAARELAAYRRLSDRHDHDPAYADAERALGRPEKAVEVLADLHTHDVEEHVLAEGLIVAAGALADLGRLDEAIAALEGGPLQPSSVEEHHLRLWYVLADLLERAGRRRDSRQWWDAIYATDPDFFDVSRRRLGTGPEA